MNSHRQKLADMIRTVFMAISFVLMLLFRTQNNFVAVVCFVVLTCFCVSVLFGWKFDLDLTWSHDVLLVCCIYRMPSRRRE